MYLRLVFCILKSNILKIHYEEFYLLFLVINRALSSIIPSSDYYVYAKYCFPYVNFVLFSVML